MNCHPQFVAFLVNANNYGKDLGYCCHNVSVEILSSARFRFQNSHHKVVLSQWKYFEPFYLEVEFAQVCGSCVLFAAKRNPTGIAVKKFRNASPPTHLDQSQILRSGIEAAGCFLILLWLDTSLQLLSQQWCCFGR
jgi:hypothetical protein